MVTRLCVISLIFLLFIHGPQHIESFRKGTCQFLSLKSFLKVSIENVNQANVILLLKEANLLHSKLLPILKLHCESF
jgi:hypothetical protein